MKRKCGESFPRFHWAWKFAGQFIEIKRNPVRFMGDGGRFDQPRIKRKPPHQRQLAGIVEPVEGAPASIGRPGDRVRGRSGTTSRALRNTDRPRAWPYWT